MKYYKNVRKYDFKLSKYIKKLGSWDCLCGCDECSSKCYRKYKTVKRFIKDPTQVQLKDFSQSCISYTTKKKKLEYYVYILAANEKEIVAYNIFDHLGFCEELYRAKKKYKRDADVDAFLEEVRSSIMRHYWSKFEWETCIAEVDPRLSYEELDRLNAERDKEKLRHPHATSTFDIRLDEVRVKTDPYFQIIMNWDVFAGYLLFNIDLIKKPKI